jgi:hypothetical protein
MLAAPAGLPAAQKCAKVSMKEIKIRWHACRAAHGPALGGDGVLEAHAQSACSTGTINLSTGATSLTGEKMRNDLLVSLASNFAGMKVQDP